MQPQPKNVNIDFEALVRQHQNRLFGVAFRLVRDRDRAADVVQEAFLRIYRHREAIDPTRSFEAWSAKIVVNLCLNELRQRKRWSYLEDESAEVQAADTHLDMQGLRDQIRRSCSELSPARQAALALSLMGYSYEEIGDFLDWSVSQVKTELFRTRRKLRDQLGALEEGR